MNNLPSVSIIIPAWKEEKILQATLDAVQQVRYPLDTCELIVVAGGGDTLSIASNFDMSVFGNYVVLKQEPEDSKSGALIKGLKVASNEVITLLDADTAVSKKWLREMVTILNKGFDAVNGTFHPIHENNLVSPYFIAEMIYNNSVNTTRLSGNATIAFKKEVLVKHGIDTFFKKELIGNDDYYFMNQLLSKGYKIGIAKNAIVKTYFPTNIRKFMKDYIRWNVAWYFLAKENSKLLLNHFSRSLAIFVSSLVTLISFISGFYLLLIPFYLAFALFCLKVTVRFIPAFRKNKTYALYLPFFILLHYIRHAARVVAVLASFLHLPVTIEKNYKGERI